MNKAISATIITLNEEDTIQTCIQNVAQICDEVVVLDSYSKIIPIQILLAKTLLIIALEKKTCNKIRSNFAVRINIPKIITKLTMALKLGLPTRFKIKDCKFR